jgi:hypothetical protein
MGAPIAANDNKEFYVYAWLKPDGTPFYVGKGKGKRDKTPKFNNELFMRTLRKMERNGEEPTVVRLHEGLTEFEAFVLEIVEIAKHGRRCDNSGTLTNLTIGGEGNTGWTPSEETKAKIAAKHRGKKLSRSHKAKILRAVSNPTDKTRAKMSASQTGRKHTAVTKAKMVLNNAMCNPIHRRTLSGALTGKAKSDAHKAAMSAYASDRKPEHKAKIALANRMKPPASGYKGVSFNKATGRWKVAIRIGDKRPFLGYFTNHEEAARVYDAAAIEAWGVGGCYLNFPLAANDNAKPDDVVAA